MGRSSINRYLNKRSERDEYVGRLAKPSIKTLKKELYES